MSEIERIEPLGCPFCDARPSIKQNKVYHCQLHGDPSQSISVYCKNHLCFAKPEVVAGDCYNHARDKDFKYGTQVATQEAIKRWNIRPVAKHISTGEES